MLARSAVAVAAVFAVSSSLATAQSSTDLLSGISSTCTSSVSNLLSSPFASCADISGLIPILTTSGSVVTPINSWLGTLCGQSNCSTSAIQNATGIIDAGCSSELSAGNAVVTAARSAIANFNTVKAAACLQQSSNSTYCVTELLNKVQTGLNTQLTVSSLTSLTLSDLEKIPSSEVCDDCAHALTSKLLPIIADTTSTSSAAGSSASGLSSSSISSAVGSYCGQSFLDGQVPSGIKEGSGSSSSGGSAVSSTSLTGGADLSTGSWSKVAGVAAVGFAAVAMLA